MCDLRPSGADTVTFQLFYQAAPVAVARWVSTATGQLNSSSGELKLFLLAPIAAPLVVMASGDESHDLEAGAISAWSWSGLADTEGSITVMAPQAVLKRPSHIRQPAFLLGGRRTNALPY